MVHHKENEKSKAQDEVPCISVSHGFMHNLQN